MGRSACYGSKASTILVPGNTTTIALTLSLAPASRADCTNLSDSTLASCLCGLVVVDRADLSSASSGAKVDAQSVSTSASFPESTDLIEMEKYGNDGHRQQSIMVYILQPDNNIDDENRKFLTETQQCCFPFLTTCMLHVGSTRVDLSHLPRWDNPSRQWHNLNQFSTLIMC